MNTVEKLGVSERAVVQKSAPFDVEQYYVIDFSRGGNIVQQHVDVEA
jgi:hypothetical protein